MIFSYVLENLVSHIIEIAIWFAAGAFIGKRSYVIGGLFAALVMMVSAGMTMGPDPLKTEALAWMAISAIIGLGTGLLYGRRLVRRGLASNDSPAPPEPSSERS